MEAIGWGNNSLLNPLLCEYGCTHCIYRIYISKTCNAIQTKKLWLNLIKLLCSKKIPFQQKYNRQQSKILIEIQNRIHCYLRKCTQLDVKCIIYIVYTETHTFI